MLDVVLRRTGGLRCIYEMGHNAPLLIGADSSLLWIADRENLEGKGLFQIHVLGPFFSHEHGVAGIEEMTRQVVAQASPQWANAFLEVARALPTLSLPFYSQYAVMLHYLLSGEKIPTSSLDYQIEMQPVPADFSNLKKHTPPKDRLQTYRAERALLNAVREGDMDCADTMEIAAYARVSSNSADQLNSFITQVEYYTQYIQSKYAWEFAGLYADEAVTGTATDKRTDFQRLIEDCRAGKIDRILVKSISRFARNTLDCIQTARELKLLGVAIEFEKENIDTGNMGSEMLLSILGSAAQEESLSISKNIKWSIRKRMQSGDFLTCRAPYGYILNICRAMECRTTTVCSNAKSSRDPCDFRKRRNQYSRYDQRDAFDMSELLRTGRK